MDLTNNPFEEFAKRAEDAGSGGHNIAAASQIRAAGVQAGISDEIRFSLASLNKEFARMDQTVSGLNDSIKKFNDDSGKLYKTLNKLTVVIAVCTLFSAIATTTYAVVFVLQAFKKI